MTKQTWTLTDVDNGIYEEDFSVSAQEQSKSTGDWKINRRTLRGGLSDGVDLIEIDNGRMRLFVIPTRGMGIWRAESNGKTLGWKSPLRGPVHPKFVPLTEPSGLGWLDGFDELFVRCGLESNGAPEFHKQGPEQGPEQGQLRYPLHGKIANLPAHFVELTVDDAAQTITLRGIVDETRFHFQSLRLEVTLTIPMNSTSFTIQDHIENFGGKPAELEMLYHINIGEPLLVPDSKIVAPVHKIEDRDDVEASTDGWELIGSPVARQPEQCFFIKLLADKNNQTEILLKNATGTAGTAVGFNTTALPCLTVWKNCVSSEDGYVTGLEPGTSFPNSHSVEKGKGRVITLEPGESWEAEIEVRWLTNAEEVDAVEESIQQLRD